jgi:glycolate oxidase FAD binding subunit
MSIVAQVKDNNAEDAILDQIRAAVSDGTTLSITGGNTKRFYGLPVTAAQPLSLSAHSGVISYEPTELVITARAGTSLKVVQALLAANDQQFPFDPPAFGDNATVGGMVAAGLSGPRRGYAQSVRDAVLGVRIVNGRGEILNYGGQVMKNVAGYDVSRLMAGSLGTLAVMLEVSLKVSPVPAGRETRVFELGQPQAIRQLRQWARQALPITASAWVDGQLYLRLCGTDEAMSAAGKVVSGEVIKSTNTPWTGLREQTHRFFEDAEKPLWRLSVAPATPELSFPGEQVIEWGGALRWLKTDESADDIRETATQCGGHATLFRYREQDLPDDGEVFAPLSPMLSTYHQRLKQAFDPAGIFNPGRMYRGL